ncbi:hypothetical protein OROHE_000515 [Orobanche hederae]
MCTSTKSKGLSLILLTLNIVITFHAFPTRSCGLFSTKYKIGVVNDIPKKSYERNIPQMIKVHCASKDVELGYRDLASENAFYWDVCLSDFWGSTMFFCHFWWENNEASFEVFNWDIAKDCWPKYDCLWGITDSVLSLRTRLSILSRIHLWNE